MQVVVDIRFDATEFPQSSADGRHPIPAITVNKRPVLSLVEALPDFERNHVAARNLAPRTRTEYRADLQQAIHFLTDQLHTEDVAAVERRHLETFLAELDRRGLAGTSRRRKLSSLRSFFRYLNDAGLIDHNPAAKLQAPLREKSQRRALTESEYQKLQSAARNDIRGTALIELFLQTGIRLAEAAALRIGDLQLPDRTSESPGGLRVHGKGRKERTVTLNSKAVRAINGWLDIRPKCKSDHVFVSKFGRGLGPRGIQHIVIQHLRAAGISGASTHSLRHTFATHSAKKGTKLAVLQQALGHESLHTTSIYVETAREQMDKELQANAL